MSEQQTPFHVNVESVDDLGPRIVTEFTITQILDAVKSQLKNNAKQANRIWTQRKVEKVKLVSVTATIQRDKEGVPFVKLDFGYGEKTGFEVMLNQPRLPGM